MTGLTVEPEDGETVIFGHTVSDLQTGVEVADGAITGTLKYVDSGALAADWGAGYFLALKFSDADASATSLKVGLDPSEGSGLVELDDDMNGVFKITDKDEQVFVTRVSDSGRCTEARYDLSGLTLTE